MNHVVRQFVCGAALEAERRLYTELIALNATRFRSGVAQVRMLELEGQLAIIGEALWLLYW